MLEDNYAWPFDALWIRCPCSRLINYCAVFDRQCAPRELGTTRCQYQELLHHSLPINPPTQWIICLAWLTKVWVIGLGLNMQAGLDLDVTMPW